MTAGRRVRHLLLSGLLVTAACSSTTGAPHQPGSRTAASEHALRHVVGLGDSVPAGARCGCASYVVQLARALSEQLHVPVDAQNLAANGGTSDSVLQQVRTQGLRGAADQVTVITVGANDLNPRTLSTPTCTTAAALACYRPSLQAMRDNVDAIARLLLSGTGSHGPILLTGYWNVFLDGRVGAAQGHDYVRDSDALTREANALLEAVARAHHLVYVDLYQGFKGDGDLDDTALLSPDGDHPSEAGHALITTLLQQALQHDAAPGNSSGASTLDSTAATREGHR